MTKRPKSKSASSKSASHELAAAHEKIAKLEAREAAHEHAAKVQAALYRIAETASAASDMGEFYAAVHGIVGELMYADNFYIALYDGEHNTLSYPYYRDEIDLEVPDPGAWEPMGTGQARGATAYVLPTWPARNSLPRRTYQALAKKGEFEIIGTDRQSSGWARR